VLYQICHPAILKLIKHDEQHETSFTRTILAYITCRYNAVAAAKSLYIHRSSFINRMERIKELVFIDWDDTDERLYLFLSFKILEMF
jgi:DNA-binding PucR family transcriptional regulator